MSRMAFVVISVTRKLTHLNSPVILNAMELTLSVNKASLMNSIISL